jgi:hypothetical protein
MLVLLLMRLSAATADMLPLALAGNADGGPLVLSLLLDEALPRFLSEGLSSRLDCWFPANNLTVQDETDFEDFRECVLASSPPSAGLNS